MKTGNFWDDSQVAVIDLYDNTKKWDIKAPAFISYVRDKSNAIMGVIFVEIIPNTEHYGTYVNPVTLTKKNGAMVNVNVYEGQDPGRLVLTKQDSWPLEWFGLDEVPDCFDPVIAAYDHAMGIIGP